MGEKRLELAASSNGIKDVGDMIQFGQSCARVCYSAKDFSGLQDEQVNEALQGRLISSGHHSVFEHPTLTFNFINWPKAFMMVLNNEKQYATSEKSARYTQMSDMPSEQKVLYDKWMNILIPRIDSVYPEMQDSKKRMVAIKKLAQENARYMTSVFTPTKMVHTLNLRQLNFLQGEFEKFVPEYVGGEDLFKVRLAKEMQDFLEQTQQYRIEKLDNQTDRHLSFFTDKRVEEHFGDVYSHGNIMSFAGLAQAHRHRTINYSIFSGTDLGASEEFFIPPLINLDDKLKQQWIGDLSSVAKNDFPQAQMLRINETGTIDDFRSKAFLRICGHPQYEIMQNTKITANHYDAFIDRYGSQALMPKCQQGIKCHEPCVWGGKKALERLI